MNQSQFQGARKPKRRAGKKKTRQDANKYNKAEDYYNNIVINVDKTLPPVKVGCVRSLEPPPQASAMFAAPAQKSALQIEMERKLKEFVDKRKAALQLNTSLKPIDFTADVALPGNSTQQKQPNAANMDWNAIKKGNKKRPAPQTNKPVANKQVNQGQYQAPHQDEPEDLTDDTAPNMAPQGSQQTGTATADNKLNFKFQRTAQKTPDWSEYQNKFRSIGGGSPDHETGDAEIKQEKDTEQTTNADSPDDKSRVSLTPVAGPSSQRMPQAMLAPKVEVLHGVAKPVDMPVKSRFDQRPAHYNFPGNPSLFDLGYPKGIPRSFLKQQQEENQRMYEASMNSPQPNPDTEYQPFARQAGDPAVHMDLPSWIVPRPGDPGPGGPREHGTEGPRDLGRGRGGPGGADTGGPQGPVAERAYSPSDVYDDGRNDDEPREGSESPDMLQSGQKRLSAFKRLGPLAQPKKPKLTINLTVNKEQAVREVVDQTDEASLPSVPVHLRQDIIESEDEVVKKYLPFWPWKRNNIARKTVSARFSKSVMILEQEQMEAAYEKDNQFVQVSVKGYPKTWTKEDVLDAILECVKGKTFIPCFVEFTPQECKFLVIRCRAALITIHKVGFCIRKDDVELTVSIAMTDTSLNQIDLIPRLVLRKRLMLRYDGEKSLDLREFFLQKDVSHFLYFPLNRQTNQMELITILSEMERQYITEINLSHNRITNLDGFNLCQNTPRLKHLDLSYNRLERATDLLPLRALPLRSLKLEGNPLCHDYVDSAHYVKVLKMMFSELMELDGVRIPLKGEFLPMKRNYCPEAAVPIVDKFLGTFFPLLEAPFDDRATIEDMYDKEAVMTITFKNKLRYGTAYRYFRNLFLRSRCLEEGDMESIKGASTIGTLVNKWPAIQHDRYTITVDVLHHDDFTTILRTGGVIKVIAESLAEDEHLLQFTRNTVLHTRNGVEYKIYNEMLYWDVPCEQLMETAFNITTVRPRQLSLKLESPPDQQMKYKLAEIFMKVTDIGRKRALKCLELKNYDLRSALEFYVSLLRLGDTSAISFKEKKTQAKPKASASDLQPQELEAPEDILTEEYAAFLRGGLTGAATPVPDAAVWTDTNKGPEQEPQAQPETEKRKKRRHRAGLKRNRGKTVGLIRLPKTKRARNKPVEISPASGAPPPPPPPSAPSPRPRAPAPSPHCARALP